jgi:hypothetical protein
MHNHTTKPPFGEKSPQGQPAAQAAPGPEPGYTTTALAERHEALWLNLSALHKDIVALGAKKPNAPTADAVRIVAEGLLSDCAPFIRQRRERLPVAALDLAGLAVQLGQALAALEDWESRHTSWDERFNCRIWRLHRGYRPIMRLKPPAAALTFQRTDFDDLRGKLAVRIERRERGAYEQGFEAGRAARAGAPADPTTVVSDPAQTYPRLRSLG